jgi:hypothetical protein
VLYEPAEIWVNVSGRAVDCPKELSPQHTALPSVRSPQMWVPPAEI